MTKTTQLTTIDANAGLEVYLNIPVQQAPQLKIGLPVRLVDDTGATARDRGDQLHFAVGGRYDADGAGEGAAPRAGGFRTSQYVRAQVIWTTEPGLTVPVTAVTRINGQFFAFVAETGQGGGSSRVSAP